MVLHKFDDYYYGYEGDKPIRGYVDIVNELLEKYPLDLNIVGENNEKNFIRLFGSFLRLRNILMAFDEFAGKEILSERDRQDYQSRYVDLYDKWNSKTDEDKENVIEDLVFELELVRQDEINIDYILQLIEKYKDTLCKDKEIVITIEKAIGSSPELRSKKELIESFIETINPASSIIKDWAAHVNQKKEQELEEIIQKENLDPGKTRKFIENAFRDGVLRTTGTDLDAILPPVSLFGKQGASRVQKRQRVIACLIGYFQTFFGLV